MVPLTVLGLSVVLAIPNAVFAVTPAQSALLRALQQCLRDVASHTGLTYASPCAMRDVSTLVGTSRADIINALGEPNGLGYSFYSLCEDCIGGGPELLIQFNSAGVVNSLRWMHTQ